MTSTALRFPAKAGNLINGYIPLPGWVVCGRSSDGGLVAFGLFHLAQRAAFQPSEYLSFAEHSGAAHRCHANLFTAMDCWKLKWSFSHYSSGAGTFGEVFRMEH
jgi:hypothetical protein